jgi:arginine repressor
MLRSLVSPSGCTIDGTTTNQNPLSRLINQFFGVRVPAASVDYILRNVSDREMSEMERAVDSGMGLSSNLGFLNRFKNDQKFEDIWRQCERQDDVPRIVNNPLVEEFTILHPTASRPTSSRPQKSSKVQTQPRGISRVQTIMSHLNHPRNVEVFTRPLPQNEIIPREYRGTNIMSHLNPRNVELFTRPQNEVIPREYHGTNIISHLNPPQTHVESVINPPVQLTEEQYKIIQKLLFDELNIQIYNLRNYLPTISMNETIELFDKYTKILHTLFPENDRRAECNINLGLANLIDSLIILALEADDFDLIQHILTFVSNDKQKLAEAYKTIFKNLNYDTVPHYEFEILLQNAIKTSTLLTPLRGILMGVIDSIIDFGIDDEELEDIVEKYYEKSEDILREEERHENEMERELMRNSEERSKIIGELARNKNIKLKEEIQEKVLREIEKNNGDITPGLINKLLIREEFTFGKHKLSQRKLSQRKLSQRKLSKRKRKLSKSKHKLSKRR